MKRRTLNEMLSRLRIFLGATGLLACSPYQDPPSTSAPLVTDVSHTIAKRQSIGNCWLYAASTWLESMALSQQNENLDVSESYWTWWYFHEQLLRPYVLDEIATGGSWNKARFIILKHGFISEGDFLPTEKDVEMSERQKEAVEYINQSLRGGELKDPRGRTPELVRRVLDEAFGSNMIDAETLAQTAHGKTIRVGPDGQVVTLRDLLDTGSPDAWFEVRFPRVYGEGTAVLASTLNSRVQLWRRVFRALNDKQPVVMSLMIDFNALDSSDGTFKGDRLRERGVGLQGGHLTVLEDYTVQDVPGIGSIGQGEVSPELQQQALLGRLDRLVVKNSWGANRPERGIKDGLTLFDRSYLEDQFAWKEDEDDPDTDVIWYTTLGGFVLPPGY